MSKFPRKQLQNWLFDLTNLTRDSQNMVNVTAQGLGVVFILVKGFLHVS